MYYLRMLLCSHFASFSTDINDLSTGSKDTKEFGALPSLTKVCMKRLVVESKFRSQRIKLRFTGLSTPKKVETDVLPTNLNLNFILPIESTEELSETVYILSAS